MRRRRRRGRAGPAGIEEFSSTSIFITPMLDMSFQILAFFVFTFQPTPPEGELPISLGTGAAAGAQAPTDPTQAAAPGLPRLRPYVAVRADGAAGAALGRIEMIFEGRRLLIGGSEGFSGADANALANLQAELLKARRLIRLDPADPRTLALSLQFHPQVRWGEVIKLMDACRQMRDERGDVVTLFPQLEIEAFQGER
ncbi:MAG TPA: hypothetical protein PKD86_06770 [Gemmatales bacterium]|nr:hypothetical protein [Gemmatales bacterium]